MGSREVSYFFRPSTESSKSLNVYRKLNFASFRFTSVEGQDRHKPLPYNPNQPVAAQVQESFAKSLANLGAENIDALLLHSPLGTREQTLEAWMELIKLRKSGRVSLIGISNVYDVETLQYVWEKTGVKPDIVQNRWYKGNNWDKAVVALCKKESIHYE
jgi:diketogulonate reductase-like aldo/keto reductase